MKKKTILNIGHHLTCAFKHNFLKKFHDHSPGLTVRMTILLCMLSITTVYAQIPTNQYVPVVIGGANNTFTASNLTAGTNLLASFLNTDRLIDADLNSFSQNNNVYLGNGYIEFDYSGGFVAGTNVGFVMDKGTLSLALLSSVTITTYSDPKPGLGDGTVVQTITSANLIGAGLGTDRERIAFTSNAAFRRVRLTFSGVDVGSLLTPPRVYYADVLVPQAGTVANCNINTPLVQATSSVAGFPAVVAYGTTGLTGVLNTIANVRGILNGVSGIENIVNNNATDYATVNTNLNVAGGAYITTRLLAGSIQPGHFAGFEVENTTLLSLGLLNGLTVEVYNNGAFVQRVAGANLLNAAIITAGNRQTVGFLVTQGAFNEVRLLFNEGLLEASLGALNIYSAVVKSFCAPTAPLGNNVVLANGHPSTNGMGITVNSNNSGLVGASVLGFSESLDNLIDSDPNNYVELNGTLNIGVANPATLSVATPQHVFTNDEYAGFIVRGTNPIADVGLLTNIAVTTFRNGAPVETNTAISPLLLLNALDVVVLNDMAPGTNAQILGFKTTQDFDEVQLSVGGLASVGNTLQVFRAFAAEEAALPVTFGDLNAVLKGNNLQINWSTISETNNKEFIVEGSADGNQWVKLGTVASQAEGGNSDASINYNFSKTVQELIALSGFAMIPAAILVIIALMLFPSVKRKTAFLATPVLALVLAFVSISCNKSGDSYETGEQPIAYVRIAQVDKDGTTTYSKVVAVIKK